MGTKYDFSTGKASCIYPLVVYTCLTAMLVKPLKFSFNIIQKPETKYSLHFNSIYKKTNHYPPL